MGVNTLLSIGTNGLLAHQVALNVTGNNVANVNTEGYSRQLTRFEAYQPMNARPGQIGMGAYAAEIYRAFNQFAEKAYLERFTHQSRWQEQQFCLQPVESLFNESNRAGLNSALGIFFQDWQDLSVRPDDLATREALLSDADNLARLMRNTQQTMLQQQREMDLCIQQSVDEVNEILEAIHELNRQIVYDRSQVNNPNSLYDKRDQLIRKLSEHLDISLIDRTNGDLAVYTKCGQPLVDGEAIYKLEVRDARIERHLLANSKYTGDVVSSGKDGFEYTLEIVRGGDIDSVPPPAFRVSLDGGRTWLKNEDGTELHVELEGPADPNDPNALYGATRPVVVKDLEISFTVGRDFNVGDRFEIVPKKGLYWVKPTREALNITPQTMTDGTDNSMRVTGGRLTAYFTVRDQHLTRYMDRMDALAKALIWETNAIHCQGAGNTMLKGTIGSYAIKPEYRTQPLGLSSTGLTFYDRLTIGNVNFTFYDKNGDPVLVDDPYRPAGSSQYGYPLVFAKTATDGSQNFDPLVHSLQDVCDAINSLPLYPVDAGPPPVMGRVSASILEGQLVINAPAGGSFALSSDTAGLMAGLGINNFFIGTGAEDIGIKTDLLQDHNLLAHGTVNADGTVAEGDNTTCRAMAGLSTKEVKLSTTWEYANQSLAGYHANLVAGVGADMRTTKFNADYNKTLADELDERVSAISGVNLDEEMTSLIKFQHAYTAQAKLITTADQMLQTILSLKQ